MSLSRFNWFSISSFLAFPSLSSVLMPHPMLLIGQEKAMTTARDDGDGRPQAAEIPLAFLRSRTRGDKGNHA